MSINLSLDQILALYIHLPPYTRPTCHIAGTNGKGSITAILSSIFASANPPLSVGRFNSPHLVHVHDSIALDGKTVDLDMYTNARDDIVKVASQHGLNISSFELLTLTALCIFERAQVDVVVLEVGMGGRLDATNIIPDESVAISALSNVDLDHQAFLGQTVAAIAREKASISRRGKPFVVGQQTHAEVNDAALSTIQASGAHHITALEVSKQNAIPGLLSTDHSLLPPPPQCIHASLPCFTTDIVAKFPLAGDHQLQNLGLALTIVSTLITSNSIPHLDLQRRLTSQCINRGISNVKWLGRLSFHSVGVARSQGDARKVLVLVDGAHNAASSTALANYISKLFLSLSQPISLTYILALSHSPPKTPEEVLKPLLSIVFPSQLDFKINIAVTGFPPVAGMPWVKPVDSAELQRVAENILPSARISRVLDVCDAFESLDKLEGDATRSSLVVVAGSLYLVADFYRALSRNDSGIKGL